MVYNHFVEISKKVLHIFPKFKIQAQSMFYSSPRLPNWPKQRQILQNSALIATFLFAIGHCKINRQRSVSMLGITLEMQEISAQVMSFWEPSPSNLVS